MMKYIFEVANDRIRVVRRSKIEDFDLFRRLIR